MELAARTEMHTYCGGLGLLAGDTARESADLEIPIVFVTMLNRTGYFRQEIGPKGEQVELPDRWDPRSWCKRLPTTAAVEIEERSVEVQPWLHLVVGQDGFQNPVLLLDTDIDRNTKDDRTLTDSLYGGDAAYRLKQEIVLGIGGLRVLRTLGFDIHTYHMNEGHASLLTLELLRDVRTGTEGTDRSDPALRVPEVRRQCVFTTHSPVEAAHDQFDYDLVERLFARKIDLVFLKSLAGKDRFNLTRLGLNLSHYVNGVSRRHAETTRKMFPGYRIHAVTNGVHLGTWTHPEFARLYDAKFPEWKREPELLVRALQLDDNEVWDCHQKAKRSLLERIRESRGVSLDPEAMTVVFARRMVAYKRPLLIFEDLGRLTDIVARRRFQLILTGKAYPADKVGKDFIRRLHAVSRDLDGRLSCVFLPNYDMDWAKALVAGCDVWFQNPLPPMEASGTSGMKAALNGGLNLSTLDGWWVEGCIEGVTGWSIPHTDGEETDRRDAAALYDQLEKLVLPCYYDDTKRWRFMMKHAIALVGPYFNSQRMLRQYASEAYLH